MGGILFFDTETTGLPDRRDSHIAAHQPHVVQLAAILCREDGAPLASINVIVDAGVPIPAAASDVHGITDEVAQAFGISPRAAISAFGQLVRNADIIVAHNIDFDLFLLESMWRRNLTVPPTLAEHLGQRGRFCTMAAYTPICNLPPTERMIAAGFNGPKVPKLQEAYRHVFSRDFAGAHDALADVNACRELYLALKNQREVA